MTMEPLIQREQFKTSAAARQAVAARKKRLKEAGLCQACGQEAATAGLVCAKCRTSATASYLRWRAQNPEAKRAGHLRYLRKLRADVITAYGGECSCCGESHPEFLTISHPDGDGAAHRRELTGFNVGGTAFYRRLRKLGFPPGLEVLCWNCNAARQFHGYCPHTVSLPAVST